MLIFKGHMLRINMNLYPEIWKLNWFGMQSKVNIVSKVVFTKLSVERSLSFFCRKIFNHNFHLELSFLKQEEGKLKNGKCCWIVLNSYFKNWVWARVLAQIQFFPGQTLSIILKQVFHAVFFHHSPILQLISSK